MLNPLMDLSVTYREGKNWLIGLLDRGFESRFFICRPIPLAIALSVLSTNLPLPI